MNKGLNKRRWIKIVLLVLSIFAANIFIAADFHGIDLTDIHFFERDKQSRYIAFALRNPELCPSDVVWMVNAGIDRPFYSEIRIISEPSAIPALVNKFNKLPPGYTPPNLVPLASGRLVTAETRDAFEAMRDAAWLEGFRIFDESAFRSYQRQQIVHNNFVQRHGQAVADTFSARPGHSEHQTGRAIDIRGSFGGMGSFGNTPEFGWVSENAYKFGFIIRYPQGKQHITGYIFEPWHITYVGVDVSRGMREKGITTLEEYYIKYIANAPHSAGE